jgi:CelD/BcsL family acetyltransferase involved in cellulose biosynthesis
MGTAGFDALANEWNPLVRRSRFNTVFLLTNGRPPGGTIWEKGDLWILAFRDTKNGKLVGIAPLYRITLSEGENVGKRQFNIVGCINVSDYLDLIVEAGREGEVYARLLQWLYSAEAPEWEILDLCNLPEVSRTWQEIPSLLEAQGLTVRTFEEDVAPQFALPFRYETYLQEQVEKKQRHEIRRKQRRAERECVLEFHVSGSKDALEAEMDDFIALQRRQSRRQGPSS